MPLEFFPQPHQLRVTTARARPLPASTPPVPSTNTTRPTHPPRVPPPAAAASSTPPAGERRTSWRRRPSPSVAILPSPPSSKWHAVLPSPTARTPPPASRPLLSASPGLVVRRGGIPAVLARRCSLLPAGFVHLPAGFVHLPAGFVVGLSKYWDRNSKYWPPSDVYLFAVILIETSEETMVATWDAYRVRVFCDICMEEVNNNNRDGGFLSKKGYENLERKFYEKVGEKLVRKQFKNKWDQLKKEYTWWMELLNATGLGWDPQTKTMDADDDWWKIHLEMRPDHAKFRNGPPPNLEQQDVMFRKAHVTGESAAIAGQETGGGKEAPILLEDDRGTSSKITGKRKFGAGEGNEKESPFFTVYNNALNTLVSRNEGSSSTKADKVPTMKEFLATVRECGVSEGTDIMFTASKLAMNRDSREVFAAFATNEGRLDWLQRTHAEMNK
ncbi:hypothetical protein ZWY2020_051519 [Hordeum vulgare]|nr:hypothetical protein ZWY2020_051519 [Hordeum vulgare]